MYGLMAMKINDIKIYPCFAANSPKAEKMEQKEWLYAESGMGEFDIVLDSGNYLIDGYCGYLIAQSKGLTHIPVRYGRRQIVKASHKPGGKLYAWELPGLLIDRVSAGDKVLVHTQRGIKVVTVEVVEEYAGQEPDLLEMIIKVRQKGVQHNG